MKGGRTPIHIQRWSPADYQNDEHVRLLKARRDYRTLNFYRQFLDQSFLAGGDLPADPEALAAVVEMPQEDVEGALAFCIGRLIKQRGNRLAQARVLREVANEIAFRDGQIKHAQTRWVATGKPQASQQASERLANARRAPSAKRQAPAPTPTPTPTPSAGAVTPNGTEPATDPDANDYANAVSEAWGKRRGEPLRTMKPSERAMVEALIAEHVPLRVALKGIEDCRGSPKASTPLTYAEGAIKDENKRWRKAMTV